MARKPKTAADAGDEPAKKEKKKRNAIFVTLDDDTELRLQKFIDSHRIKPDRAAVALASIIELLDKEGY